WRVGEAGGIEADVDARESGAVTIERSVLDGFRRNRRAELMKRRERACVQRFVRRYDRFAGEPTAEQLEHQPIAGQTGCRGAIERTPQEQQILVGMLPGCRVETINREMREDFPERAPDRRTAHVGAGRARETMECPRRAVELRREAAIENLPAA